MEQKIRIQCPCGANLTLNNTPDVATKSYTCPVCHQLHHFSEFKLLPPVGAAPQSPGQASEAIRIKCQCGATLQIKKTPGIESKSITCPVCGANRPFSEYAQVDQPRPNPGGSHTSGGITPGGGVTVMGGGAAMSPFKIVNCATGESYNLLPGENIIGRKAQTSKASIQIATDDKKLSREHLVITVERCSEGFIHYVKLYKEAVNPTKLGKNDLKYGDELVALAGAHIYVNTIDLQFSASDLDATII